MNVSLTRRLEAFVHKSVKSGRYQSSSEVVREALRMLEDHERAREHKLAELRKAIDIGVNQIERGEYVEFNEKSLREHFDKLIATIPTSKRAKRRASA